MYTEEFRLKNALYFAGLGWKLFPAVWKKQQHIGLVKWSKQASSDEKTIRVWSHRHPEAYFCVAARQSDITILDVDDKNGKCGSSSLLDLQLNYAPLPLTVASRTPNGGLHYFFRGHVSNSVDRLGSGLDTPVMSPLPGSIVIGKGEYEWIPGETTPAPVPKWLASILPPRKDVSEVMSDLIDPDHDEAISLATSYAKTATPSIQGEGGNQNAYKVAARVRDFGVSQEMCLEILLQHWYPRCDPNSKPGFVERLVSNAYHYSTQPLGNSSPVLMFPSTGIIVANEPRVVKPASLFTSARSLRLNRKPPEWIVKRYIEAETTVQWFGDPGVLKSFLSIDLAVAISSGQQWAGQDVNPGAVIYVAGEGHGGIARRLEACCRKRNIDLHTNLPLFVSNTSIQLDSEQTVKFVSKTIQHISESPVRLIIIDTLAMCFGRGDENSTKDMSIFINLVNNLLRKTLGCAALIIHHAGKGDKHQGRGSSALEGGVDSTSKIHREDMKVCIRTPKKMKDAEPFSDLWFDAEVINLGYDEDLLPITSLALNYGKSPEPEPLPDGLGGNQALVLQLLSEHGDLNFAALKEKFREYKSKHGLKFDRSNLRRTVEKMVEGEVIDRKNHVLRKKG